MARNKSKLKRRKKRRLKRVRRGAKKSSLELYREIRKEKAPPQVAHKDKSKYSRKEKHKNKSRES